MSFTNIINMVGVMWQLCLCYVIEGLEEKVF